MDDFFAILTAHQTRYPRMEPQDYGKLAHQREFGPAHLAMSPGKLRANLLAEWEALPQDLPPKAPEPVGGKLCRFHLTGEYDPAQAASLLAHLVHRTGQRHHGSQAGLKARLHTLTDLGIPGLEPWLQAYLAQGCPLLSHSRAFREAYHPHYRLLDWNFACYFPVLLAVEGLLRQQPRVLLAIDGHCGSGKTHLAQTLSQVFSCALFHMDDYYLPPSQRQPDWAETPGGNMDLVRFQQEVLRPLQAGQAVQTAPFDCQQGRLGPITTTPPQPLTVIEGSYSHHPALENHYDLKVFLTCAPTLQRSRLQQREGEAFAEFEAMWMPMEWRYFQRFQVEAASDLVVDTSNFF